ncbi:MAG: ATP-binding protein [Candidatus Protochlamydia sp.]|nr:ATP-binding protein [Candidatus Protochlamydia sp.]
MERFLQILQEEFKATLKKSADSTVRQYEFPKAQNLAKVAIGIRRSGKTYFLFQTMRDLIAKNALSLDRLLYINFEDDRLLPIDQKKMGEMIDALYTLQPELHNHRCYLFLDEVQNVDGWPVVVRRLLDTKDLEIYITGSSAKLLSKEIATSLRGRSVAMEIQPFNFHEYLDFKKIPLPSKPFGRKMLDQYRSHLLDFFQKGGFPGVQDLPIHERREMLQNYVEVVVFRDVIERHKVSNLKLLKYFVSALLKNSASRFSINKFYKDITSQGLKVSKDTLHHYLDYLEDAFLIYIAPIFTESLRTLETTPKKIYAVDNGLIHANTFNFSLNFGKLLENQVYLDLRRQKKDIFYYSTSEGYEVDFITKDQEGNYEIIQVVWDQSDPVTFEREVRALRSAEKELGIKGRVIDWEQYLIGWQSV